MNKHFLSADSPTIAHAERSTVSDSTSSPLTPDQILHLGSASLENHIGSVLVLSEDGTVLYATESLQHRLAEFADQQGCDDGTPREVALICQMMQQCRRDFPHQNWAIEFDIYTKEAISFRIRSRWLKLEGFAHPCILLIVEDRQKMVQDIVIDEAQDWGLTPREQEVWIHFQQGCKYHQIAEKLFITLNTVKKHMRSIHAKRRACGSNPS